MPSACVPSYIPPTMGQQDEEKGMAMTGRGDPMSRAGEKAGGWKPQKPSTQRVREGSLFSPWSNWRAWIVMLAGVLIGQVIGFSPPLFVGIAVFCLLCGWLSER